MYTIILNKLKYLVDHDLNIPYSKNSEIRKSRIK